MELVPSSTVDNQLEKSLRAGDVFREEKKRKKNEKKRKNGTVSER
jgi:hypothetical protein